LCGDSTKKEDVERLMDGKKADMVFTDPPYGMKLDVKQSNNITWDKDGWKGKSKNYDNVIGDHGDFKDDFINNIFGLFEYCKEIFLWGADYYSDLLREKNDGSWFVWNKTRNSEDKEQIKSNGSMFELCWSKKKHKREVVNVLWKGLMGTELQDIRTRVHPTQKPIQICEWFIEKFSKNSETVTDLFLGSGSTLIACEKTNRICYGMEIDPHYCDVTIKRWEDFTGSKAVKI